MPVEKNDIYKLQIAQRLLSLQATIRSVKCKFDEALMIDFNKRGFHVSSLWNQHIKGCTIKIKYRKIHSTSRIFLEF